MTMFEIANKKIDGIAMLIFDQRTEILLETKIRHDKTISINFYLR